MSIHTYVTHYIAKLWMVSELVNLSEVIALILVVFVFCSLLKSIIDSSPPAIDGIFAIPEYPIIGNLLQVWNNPSLVFMKWSEKYGVSLFQIRLGSKRVLVVNSYDDIKDLWVKHSVSNNSRPVAFTFHDIISVSQGLTVGSTPAGETYQRKKKVVSSDLNRRNVDSMSTLVDEETRYTIMKILTQNIELSCPPSCNIFLRINTRWSDIDLLPYAQNFSLRSSIRLAYGWKVDCYNRDATLARDIIETEGEIIKLRSPITNIQDFFPILRRYPLKSLTNFRAASYWRDRRDKYMNYLFDDLVRRLKASDPDAGDSLVGKCIRSNKQNLTPAEINSICLTLVSAGLDNTSFNFNHLMGHLSHPEYGYAIQEIAFNKLMHLYNNSTSDAWVASAHGLECDYVVALVEECLRFLTILPLGLPRTTTKPTHFKGAIIPAGTILFMNAYAANHDPQIFPEPYRFAPERWLNPETGKLLCSKETSHLSFGAGSRMCSGKYLAMKELYTLVCRMILVFKIRRPIDNNMLMKLDPFENNSCPSATSFEPCLFKVRLKQRQYHGSDELHNMIVTTGS